MKAILEKLAAMGSKQRWVLVGALVCVLAAGYYFLVYTDHADRIETLTTEVQGLEKTLREYQDIAARFGELKARVAELDAALKVAVTLLPETREIPELLTQVSRLGSESGLEFRLFKPEPEQRRDFYAEVPVTLTIQGKFHDVARFFDHLSKLPRIVNVTDIKMTLPRGNELEPVLTTDCRLTTFRFLELGEAEDKKRGKADERKKGS